jgi:uncharacterized repeat protein (TIGR01451 family)
VFLSIGVVSASDVNETTDIDDGLNSDALVSDVQSNVNQTAYLVLDNDADKENIHIGEEVTWILEVQNFGPDIAKNTRVHDELPEGLKYLHHTLTKGTFSSETGIWDIGDLKVEDGVVKLFITCVATSVGEKINKANLTSDTFNINNESYEEEEIDVVGYDYDKDVKKDIYLNNQTGNPLLLILIMLFTVFSSSIIIRR